MTYDICYIEQFYKNFSDKLHKVRQKLNRPLTFAEKILYVHFNSSANQNFHLTRGVDYANYQPDRVAMQDATAQMAILQFMNAGKNKASVPTTIHCDHLIRAKKGAEDDLINARVTNSEIYDFLESASIKYGFGFWQAGSGIIHQIVLENYAFPGGMMIGTDSHTPNAGGLGMIAIGVGGADAVDVMSGLDWELKTPKLIGVHLTGKLSNWVSPKDVILKLAGLLTVKGATNSIIEYFGEGASTISCTGKATICNMGAEVGATCSVFPYDENMHRYLQATHRNDVASMAEANKTCLQADQEVQLHPEIYFDEIIYINLSELEPHVNGPFTPDLSTTISSLPEFVKKNNYPTKIDAVLIGSCTNSSYEDLSRAADVVDNALKLGLKPQTQFIINPGSEQIKLTAEKHGILNVFRKAGAIIMANACGPCIGQWERYNHLTNEKNSIITTFNRNFAKRADGNPNTHAFITSPEVAAAFVFSPSLLVNPCQYIPVPQTYGLPKDGFQLTNYSIQSEGDPHHKIIIKKDSCRLQTLQPFLPWEELCEDIHLLIKIKGKCTTDHISMAGTWLKFRGHLENISQNLLLGAENAFTGDSGMVLCDLNGIYTEVAKAAKAYQNEANGSFIVAEDNYGEGSSREHAAMEPRFLGVKFVLAKSFARIHETNLKKQGILALTFEDPNDYSLISEGDKASILGLREFKPNSKLSIMLTHQDGSTHIISAKHTYNEKQIKWFKSGSALNYISKNHII